MDLLQIKRVFESGGQPNDRIWLSTWRRGIADDGQSYRVYRYLAWSLQSWSGNRFYKHKSTFEELNTFDIGGQL